MRRHQNRLGFIQAKVTLGLCTPCMLVLLLLLCLGPAHTGAAWPNATVTVYPRAATPDQAPTHPGRAVVKGTLTYYFNDNYGEKPDTGASVWLGAGAVPTITTVRDVSDFTTHAYKTAKADGEGNFRLTGLPAGRYTILIQSSHANGKPESDDDPNIIGKLYQETFNLDASEEHDISHDFGMTWN